MDFSSWFTWDVGKILFWSAIGLMTWLVSLTKDIKDKIKKPILVGFAASLMGAFEIGLTSILSGLFYLMFLHVFKFWFFKFEKKGIIKFDNKTKDDDDDFLEIDFGDMKK